jgi:hypothetical protein
LIRVKNPGNSALESNAREYRGSFLDQDRSRSREMILAAFYWGCCERPGDRHILTEVELVVPHGLGQTVRFLAGEGPRLTPVVTADNIDQFSDKLNLVVLAPVVAPQRRRIYAVI